MAVREVRKVRTALILTVSLLAGAVMLAQGGDQAGAVTLLEGIWMATER